MRKEEEQKDDTMNHKHKEGSSSGGSDLAI